MFENCKNNVINGISQYGFIVSGGESSKSADPPLRTIKPYKFYGLWHPEAGWLLRCCFKERIDAFRELRQFQLERFGSEWAKQWRVAVLTLDISEPVEFPNQPPDYVLVERQENS